MSLTEMTVEWPRRAAGGLNFLAPLLDLAIRLYVANVFWKSGLTKIANWESTVYLFTYEYQVPLLPPEVAAWLGTGIELALPPLLAIGFATRWVAIALLAFNVMAVISYPDLNPVGLKDHFYWGVMLAVTVFHGPGRLSVDYLLERITHGRRRRDAASATGG